MQVPNLIRLCNDHSDKTFNAAHIVICECHSCTSDDLPCGQVQRIMKQIDHQLNVVEDAEN